MATAPLLLVALVLDSVFGEPRWLWARVPHPAVLMGRIISICDSRLNRGASRRISGILVVLGLSLGALGLGWIISELPLGWLWQVLGAAILLAQRSLADHVEAVAVALRQSVPKGRQAVSTIVGRDTSALDQAAISRAAIESAAENMSDGVIAPAFWFLIGGLPGILFYKIVNTADSMIGHRTDRYEAFGWAAARLDDVLNYVPARLTAGLIALTHGSKALTAAMRDGPHHRSINAGWPEAAMAAALGLALSGPRSYEGQMTSDPVLNAAGTREASAGDISASVRVLWRVWAMLFAASFVLTVAH
ncbi:adenosylcobinamide-phosphate synthase CbiB [Gymnodinialimonas sp. 2305UL16-5]|uniref:adenosylcobinamide-phosphate synthase CbiB n=1 Tax=Gymnodinialimonas mytili TaxID=3126503 RepID=UPI0030B3F398